MKFAGKFERITYTAKGDAEITFSTAQRVEAEKVKTIADRLLDVKVEPHHERRSLDANAYFWVLAQKLAEKLSLRGQKPVSAEEVYRNYIRDIGAYQILPVKVDAVEQFTKAWESHGKGWIVVFIGESKLKGYANLQVFYGSSVYNKEQMGRLIDAVVADCKEFGIETKTPEEIANMLSLMEEE